MRAARVTLHIAHTSPMADHLEFDYSKGNQDIDNIYWLADQDPDSLTDEKLEQWVRRHAETLYHPVRIISMRVQCTSELILLRYDSGLHCPDGKLT